MSGQIIIDPEGLKSEAEAYGASARAVRDVQCSIPASKTNVSSFLQCIQALDDFVKLIQEFTNLSYKDANSLLLIRADWMQLDKNIANQIMQKTY